MKAELDRQAQGPCLFLKNPAFSGGTFPPRKDLGPPRGWRRPPSSANCWISSVPATRAEKDL